MHGVRLRPWRADDLDRYFTLLSDPVVWKTLTDPYPDPFTRDVARDLLTVASMATHHTVRAVLANEEPVGQVRLFHGTAEVQTLAPEISYWIGRPYWGRGYARAAVQQILAAHAQAATVTARVHMTNFASRKVLERTGFDLDPGWVTDGAWLTYTRAA